jgi:hypothetical protein
LFVVVGVFKRNFPEIVLVLSDPPHALVFTTDDEKEKKMGRIILEAY